eukprot:12577378-Alexandrium_andersonii.AAC.1
MVREGAYRKATQAVLGGGSPIDAAESRRWAGALHPPSRTPETACHQAPPTTDPAAGNAALATS